MLGFVLRQEQRWRDSTLWGKHSSFLRFASVVWDVDRGCGHK